MSDPTPQEIMATQGTRLSDVPPWMSYAAEFEEKLNPQLEAEIEEYSKRRHTKSTSQNEEELCRQKEANQGIAKQYQWLTPEEYADAGPRIGRILHSSMFLNTLRNNVKNYHWFYRDHPQPRKLTLVYSGNGGQDDLQVGCWVQSGYMPEYSLMRFDHHGVPLDERMRGWRTCLLQLILKGLVSEQTAIKMFGPAYGPASERYNKTLYEWRTSTFEQ